MKKRKQNKKAEEDLSPSEKKPRMRKPVDLTKKLDKVFSAYIRLRDAMPNGCFRCISCGQIKRFEQGDCGHYHSRTHMGTRWEPDNCNMECRSCNRVSSDHLIGYRRNLIEKIGFDRVNRLEVLARSSKHWQDFELKDKIEYFTREVKRLRAEKGINVKI